MRGQEKHLTSKLQKKNLKNYCCGKNLNLPIKIANGNMNLNFNIIAWINMLANNGMQIGDVAGLGALNYQFTTKVF
jgi:hypothetical protein